MRFLNPPFRKWIISAALVAVLVLSHTLWLTALGRYLVSEDSAVQADIIVVLAGDGYGHRILRAAELVRQGKVKVHQKVIDRIVASYRPS